jgi:ornithine cyclodeaminase
MVGFPIAGLPIADLRPRRKTSGVRKSEIPKSEIPKSEIPTMLILNARAVRDALPMPRAIAAMKAAFAALTEGRALVPPRVHMDIKAHDAVCLVMPAYVGGTGGTGGVGPEDEALAVKVVSLYPGNVPRNLARIQAAVMLFEPDTGRPLALLDGAALTAIRTGAASGAATDLLARPNASRVAILGAGVQARTQLQAVCTVRDIAEVRIYSPTRAKADALIADLAGVDRVPRNMHACASAAQAVRGAEIICAATTSKTPVFDDADIADGAHVNLVGSYQPHVRECPAATVKRAFVVVDSYTDAKHEAGDLIQPIEAGEFGWDHVKAELGELVLGRKPGRTSDEQLTLFKSVGVAVQDAYAAGAAVRRAREMGLGQWVEW